MNFYPMRVLFLIMPFCPECGKENSADQKFCTGCGIQLPKSPVSPAVTAKSDASAPANPGTATPPAPAKPLGLIIGIILVIALVAAGILVGLPALNKNAMIPAATPQQITPAPTVTPEIPVTLPPQPSIATTIPTPEKTVSPYKTYTSSRFGFSIDYPSEWIVNETNSLKVPSTTRYTVVEFYSPSIDRCNTDLSDCSVIRAKYIVEVETAPKTKELADYFVPESAKLLAENGGQITKKDSFFKLSGVKAYRLDYTNEVNHYEQNLISAYSLINNNAYILTYKAYAPMRSEPNLFEQYYNTANDMFASFQAVGAVKNL
jgi:hypothetical protein